MIKFIFFLSLTLTPLFAQDILPLRDRANLIDQIQKERIKKLLPKLMEEQDIDVWVMITRAVSYTHLTLPTILLV